MSLSDDIQQLRDHALADLKSAHDYYTDTTIAWGIVRDAIKSGHTVSVRNLTTGTVTTQVELANKWHVYVNEHLAEATFQQFISIFENYFLNLLRLWLLAYPQSLMAKQIDFKIVLDAPDKESITSWVVSRELNDILYGRPTSWFSYLNEKAKLGCPSTDEIDQFAEAKVSRNVLVHNRGIASKVYEQKAGRLARYKDGQRIEIPEYYHRQTWELIQKIITDLSNAAIAKIS